MGKQGQQVISPRSWLNNRITAGIKLGLENSAEMLSRLGNPEKNFKSIHVAGTNGKGSLCANLSALATKNKLLVGFFSSPHLITVEERIRVSGRPINTDFFDKCLTKVMKASMIEPSIEPTYFETTFLISVIAFAELKIDIAIIETGLGGRLDATRLVNASLCAITTISHDHSEILGDKIVDIASEKVAIFRPKTILFSLYHKDLEVRKIFHSVAGEYLRWFKPKSKNGWIISKEYAVKIGNYLGWEIKDFETHWPGRSQNKVNWIPDVKCRVSAAHNVESIRNDLNLIKGKHIMLIGMTRKANLDNALESLNNYRKCIHTIVTEPRGGRNYAVKSTEISLKLSKLGFKKIEKLDDPIEAFKKTIIIAEKLKSQVLVIGSIYLVGEIMNYVIIRDNLDINDILTIHPPLKSAI